MQFPVIFNLKVVWIPPNLYFLETRVCGASRTNYNTAIAASLGGHCIASAIRHPPLKILCYIRQDTLSPHPKPLSTYTWLIRIHASACVYATEWET